MRNVQIIYFMPTFGAVIYFLRFFYAGICICFAIAENKSELMEED
jgi:hypothetical protein